MEQTAEIKVELCNGAEGDSIYINGKRMCGNKPWGGGKITKTWNISIDEIEFVLGFSFTEEQLSKLKSE